MHHWIQIFWNPDLFTNKLSFSKETFIKRIKLKEGTFVDEFNLTNTILINSLVKKYPNLKVLLDYIYQDDDIYRQKFCAWVTGSIYSSANINIILHDHKFGDKTFSVHTCVFAIDVYKTDPVVDDIEILKSQINSNTKNLNFSLL